MTRNDTKSYAPNFRVLLNAHGCSLDNVDSLILLFDKNAHLIEVVTSASLKDLSTNLHH